MVEKMMFDQRMKEVRWLVLAYTARNWRSRYLAKTMAPKLRPPWGYRGTGAWFSDQESTALLLVVNLFPCFFFLPDGQADFRRAQETGHARKVRMTMSWHVYARLYAS